MLMHDINGLYLSVTNRCNLSCSYCSADAGPAGRKVLPEAVAERAVRDWISRARPDLLALVFSGGEPTLWGYGALNRICSAATQTAAMYAKRLSIGVQSNGTTISDRFIRWCRTWDISASFSLDGVPHISDRQRGMGNSVITGLRRLQSEGIGFALISCLSTDVVAEIDAILDWYRVNGFLKVRFNTLGYAPPGRASTHPSADELYDARRKIYFHMERYGAAGVREKNVLEAVAIFDAIVLGRRWSKQHCAELKCGAGRQVAALNPDGRWAPCIEKSMTDGLPTAVSLDQIAMAVDRYWEGFAGWDICRSCAADPICDHGCPVYHKRDHALFAAECQANKMFWSFLIDQRAVPLLREAYRAPEAAPGSC
jgi:radical SAM protein with 4Fe4S-binding SPASM domain